MIVAYGQFAEVRSRLKQGGRVVLHPGQYIVEGRTVRIRPSSSNRD